MAISTIGASALDSNVSQLGKNLIINGAMTVAQRGTQTSEGPNLTYQACDRWKNWTDGGGTTPGARYTSTQDTSVVPTGFAASLKIDCTTADGTVASDEIIAIEQPIEAQNLRHLLYGTASAKKVTLQFWYRSPKTGTHCVYLNQPDANRSIVKEFTIASADTLEFFSLTFDGDTSGQIDFDNGAGLRVGFPLVAGSSYQIAADAWSAGNDFCTSNQQNLLDNTANNIYITGVQLEVGSVATDFEQEEYGTTLAKCQRYFWRLYANGTQMWVSSGATIAANQFRGIMVHPVPMRSGGSQTLGFSAAADFDVIDGGNTTRAVTALSSDRASSFYTGLSATIAGATTGGGLLSTDATSANYIQVDDEL